MKQSDAIYLEQVKSLSNKDLLSKYTELVMLNKPYFAQIVSVEILRRMK